MKLIKTSVPMLALLVGCSLIVAARSGPPAPASDRIELAPRPVGNDDVRVTPTVLAVRKVGDSVVSIYSDVEVVDYVRTFVFGLQQRVVPTHSLGSGVLISKDGYIVTNYHVITGAAGDRRWRDIKTTVHLRDGREFDAHIVGLDKANDLAVLKIDADEPLPHAKIGRSDDLMIGETVLAMGNPYGYENSVTQGIISGTRKTLKTPNGETFRDFIQIDASLNFGNSGGPLFNVKGELIGINQLIAADPTRGMRAESIGISIPIDRVREALVHTLLNPAIVKQVRTGFSLAEDEQRRPVIAATEEGGPASNAGLQAGDTIVAVDGTVVSDALDVCRLLLTHRSGESVALGVVSGGRKRLCEIPLARLTPQAANIAWKRLGVRALDHRSYNGALIEKVRAGGPADQIGLRPYDLIIKFNGRTIRYVRDMEALLRQIRAGEMVEIEIVRLPTGDWMGGKVSLEG